MSSYPEIPELYDAALRATDAVMGAGTYAEVNQNNHHPAVQAAIEREHERLHQVVPCQECGTPVLCELREPYSDVPYIVPPKSCQEHSSEH